MNLWQVLRDGVQVRSASDKVHDDLCGLTEIRLAHFYRINEPLYAITCTDSFRAQTETLGV